MGIPLTLEKYTRVKLSPLEKNEETKQTKKKSKLKLKVK